MGAGEHAERGDNRGGERWRKQICDEDGEIGVLNRALVTPNYGFFREETAQRDFLDFQFDTVFTHLERDVTATQDGAVNGLAGVCAAAASASGDGGECGQ